MIISTKAYGAFHHHKFKYHAPPNKKRLETNMEFRKATIDDVETLVKLRKKQLLDEGSCTAKDLDQELADYFSYGLLNNTFISWLAVEDNEVIATSGVCFYRIPPSYTTTGKVAYITNMFTLPSHRRKGIASALLEKIICEARSAGYSIAMLHSSSDGKYLYPKFGFMDSEGYMLLKL